jgi:hypothetical protein
MKRPHHAYANEVRDFEQIPKAENVKLSDQELTLGANLIEQMSDEFDPENIVADTVTPARDSRRDHLIDLMQAADFLSAWIFPRLCSRRPTRCFYENPLCQKRDGL